MAAAAVDSKDNHVDNVVLVLGGSGFIGRHCIKYLFDNKLASKIVVADKSLPGTSYLSADHKSVFENKSIIEFKQSDLSKDIHIDKLFKDRSFSTIINLCGETRCGMKEDDYKTKIVDVVAKVSVAAKKNGIKKWIEISTAQVYQPDKSPSKEDSKIKPWTLIAKYRLEAEEIIKKSGIQEFIIFRPSLVFGPSDLTSITPRLACAAAYKSLGEKMKFLWDKDLKTNTVHVNDVCIAIGLALKGEIKSGSIYNLSDDSALTQGKLIEWLGDLFKIETGFLGSMLSTLAKVNLSGVAEDANDKHVPAFTKLCQEQKILNTPISPYIDKELLYDHHLSVDGSKITKESSFKYTKSASKDLIKQQIQEFITQGLFPNVL